MHCQQIMNAILLILFIWLYFVNAVSAKGWYVGRVPPSRFEYEKLNGFYTNKQAKRLCEYDIQCNGFTFKGAKESRGKKEMYFFRFVPDSLISFRNYLKYPHWTTYIVTSRDYVIVFGRYTSALRQAVGGKVRIRNV